MPIHSSVYTKCENLIIIKDSVHTHLHLNTNTYGVQNKNEIHYHLQIPKPPIRILQKSIFDLGELQQ